MCLPIPFTGSLANVCCVPTTVMVASTVDPEHNRRKADKSILMEVPSAGIVDVDPVLLEVIVCIGSISLL